MATLPEHLDRTGNEMICPIAVMMRNDLVLVGHRHYTKDVWREVSVWTHPGGRCDAGETVEQTLRREVAEEVGVSDFHIHEFIAEVSGAKAGDAVPIFACTTTQNATLQEPEKFSEWRWVTSEEYIADAKYSSFNPAARQMIVNYLKKTLR